MKQYDKYKNSGIDYIGEIPSHWKIKKLKYIGEAIIGITYSPDDIVDSSEGILVLRSSNIQNGKLAFDDCVYVKKNPSEKHLIQKGDIFICSRNGSAHLIGKNVLIKNDDTKMTFGAFMTVFRTSHFRFIQYFFNSNIFTAQTGVFSTSTINQLTTTTLNNMEVAFPDDFLEQSSIASYLDKKTAQIDTLIKQKETLLDRLQLKRQAIINEAVTMGINSKAKMKESGIEWLGQIPKHWEVKKLKYVTDGVQTGNTPSTESPEYFDDGTFNWFTPGDFNGDIILGQSKRKITEKAIEDDVARVFKENTVLLIGIGATLGKVGISINKCSANQQINAITFNEHYNPYFGAYFLGSKSEIIVSLASASTLAILNQTKTKDLFITAPPKKEQDSIVEYITKKEKRFQEINIAIIEQINKLKTYRQSIISEVVTGKIKVV